MKAYPYKRFLFDLPALRMVLVYTRIHRAGVGKQMPGSHVRSGLPNLKEIILIVSK